MKTLQSKLPDKTTNTRFNLGLPLVYSSLHEIMLSLVYLEFTLSLPLVILGQTWVNQKNLTGASLDRVGPNFKR